MSTLAVRPIAVKLDANTRERVQALAQKREAFRQNALKAWSEYQATGLHATEQEADAWLAKLENGESSEPPAGCESSGVTTRYRQTRRTHGARISGVVD